jgi:hypothetical protein
MDKRQRKPDRRGVPSKRYAARLAAAHARRGWWRAQADQAEGEALEQRGQHAE